MAADVFGQQGGARVGSTRAAHDLALAGVRARYPDAPPREQFLRLAIVTLGPDLARRVYPEIRTLDLR
jgi:hypothetical protein